MKSTKIPKRHEPVGQMDGERLVRAVEQLQSNVERGDRVRESRGMLKEYEDEILRRVAAPEDTGEHRVNFMQVIGPVIPLCHIPVDDVKVVVMLLTTHQPKSESLKIVQAQFEAVIGHLNQYIQEAIERNEKHALGMVATWTSADAEKEKKKK